MNPPGKTLFLCAGLQSGGTTLVSYSFLQRPDMDGVLDAENDILPQIDRQLARPYAWYKTTVGCFRLSEMAQHYRDAGWQVRPLLVLRDLRDVWSSLQNKGYGRNGITAEDPPLRLRVRRFIDDWRSASSTGAVTLRYEDFITNTVTAVEDICRRLDLPFEEAMLTWPKAPGAIANAGGGNESFWATRGHGLLATIAEYQKQVRQPRICKAELDWLESEFRDYNLANSYPEHRDCAVAHSLSIQSALTEPSFEVTRRYEWETKRKPLRWLLSRLGVRNQKLISDRSQKRAA